MTKHIQKWVLAIAALGALALGGSAIATAQQPVQTPAPVTQSAKTPEPVGGPDTDTIQSGDQTTPDTPGGAAEAPGTEQSPASEKPGAAEAPGTEQSPASEAAETPGTESAMADDGPGGHADEPGNPAANTQFQGVQ